MPKLRQFAFVLAIGFTLVSSTMAQDSNDFSNRKSSRRSTQAGSQTQAKDQPPAKATEIDAQALNFAERNSTKRPDLAKTKDGSAKPIAKSETAPAKQSSRLNRQTSSRRVRPQLAVGSKQTQSTRSANTQSAGLAAKTPSWTQTNRSRNSNSAHNLVVTPSSQPTTTPNTIRQTSTPRVSTRSFLPANKALEQEVADAKIAGVKITPRTEKQTSNHRQSSRRGANCVAKSLVAPPTASTSNLLPRDAKPIAGNPTASMNPISSATPTPPARDDVAKTGVSHSLSDATGMAERVAKSPVPSKSTPTTGISQAIPMPPATSSGTAITLSDEQAPLSAPSARLATSPRPFSHTTPPSPIGGGTSLNMKTLSDFSFKSPKQFLSQRKFQFASSDKFLKYLKEKQNQETDVEKKRNPMQLPKASLVRKTPAKRVRTRISPSNKVISRHFDDDDESRYLNVKSVDEPIADNPFADIRQRDDSNLLEPSPTSFTVADPSTYGTLTGQLDTMHIASYKAHNFKHRPLYFEEVNLERYGNELRFQPIISAAHFFTGAAILPYHMGAVPPGCCLSTLGHQRPGDCVPYRIHYLPQSRHGWLYQSLFVTAISL